MDRRAFTKLATALGVIAASPAAAKEAVEVTMKNTPKALFIPTEVKISVGDTVNWTNPGVITHTVTFDPAQTAKKENAGLPEGVAPFGSPDMEDGATFSHTFTAKGTYKYVCKFHEDMGMVGTVIVT